MSVPAGECGLWGLTLATMQLARSRQDLPLLRDCGCHPRHALGRYAHVSDAPIFDDITQTRCCRSSMTGKWQAMSGTLLAVGGPFIGATSELLGCVV
jgi:hypothetical protein